MNMNFISPKREQLLEFKKFMLKTIKCARKAELPFFIFFWLTLFQTNIAAQIFWQQTSGTESKDITSIVTNMSGYYFAAAFYDGVYLSKDTGITWVEFNDSLTDKTVQALAIKSDTIFAGTIYGRVFRSSIYGNGWEKVDNGLPHKPINSLVVTSNGSLLAGTKGNGIFRSENNGDRWEQIKNDTLKDSMVRALAVKVNKQNGYILAGTSGWGIYKSIDDGINWEQVNEGLSDFDILSLAFNDSGYIFAGTSAGVYRSVDDHIYWRRLKNNGLANKNVYDFSFNISKYIFAATDSGVFRSIDNGDNWKKFSSGMPDYYILTVTTDDNGRLFAGTAGGGVYRAIDSALPVIVHSPQAIAYNEQEIPIDVRATDDTGIKKTILFYRRGGEVNFDTVSVSDELIGSGHSYTLNIPANFVTDRGVEYYITASDSFDNMTRKPNKGYFSVQVIVDEPGTTNKDSLIAGSDQIAYRLVSVPLDLKNRTAKAVLEDNLGIYNNKKWRFYELRDDYFEQPDSISAYREYDEEMEMEAGKAYWLIVKEEGEHISTGPGITFSTASKYTLAIHPGWNFIGNPFNFPIPITNLLLKNKKDDFVLKSYTGRWDTVTAGNSLRPFAGLALFADSTNSDTLIINPDLSDTSSTFSNYTTSLIHNNIISSIHIIAQCQQARDGDNLAVIASDALIGKDRRDQPEPPPIGEYVSVYFPHRDWRTLAKSYCVDARPEPTDGEIWEFDVKTNIRDKVHLMFEGLESIPKEFEIWLVDSTLNITQNLRETPSYFVAAYGTEHPKSFKLIVGKSNFIESKLARLQLVPAGYQLFQNFPNPFNPATTIRYGLPEAEKVTLKVYNLLGEQVVTLVNNEQKKAGYYAAIWDGRNQAGMLVANGIYFVYMQAGKFRQSRKMLLVQ